MKFILLIAIFLSPIISFAESLLHRDSALETNGIKVEFYESSQSGIIKPLDCHLCLLKEYKFDSTIQIYRQNTLISIEQFMNEYWKSNYPTLFIDLETNQVLKVRY